MSKAAKRLMDAMTRAPGKDFTIDQIYRLVVTEPKDGLSVAEMHSRCSRAIGTVRAWLSARGMHLEWGALRHSYRAVRHKHKGGRS